MVSSLSGCAMVYLIVVAGSVSLLSLYRNNPMADGIDRLHHLGCRPQYHLYGLIKARSDCSDGLNGEQRPESHRLFVLSYQIKLSLVIIRAIPVAGVAVTSHMGS